MLHCKDQKMREMQCAFPQLGGDAESITSIYARRVKHFVYNKTYIRLGFILCIFNISLWIIVVLSTHIYKDYFTGLASVA